MKFNFFFSLPFWIACFTIVVLSRLIDKNSAPRRFVLLASSILMILCIPGFTPLNFASMLILCGFSYATGYILNRGGTFVPSLARKLFASFGVLGILGFLVFYKYRFIQALFLGRSTSDAIPPTRIVFMIGVSYFSFKMIHYIIESYRNKIESPSLMNYLVYILFFLSFISGPINRFNHFSKQIARNPTTPFKSDLRAGGERIIHGLFKKFVLVQIMRPYVLDNSTQGLSTLSLGSVLLGLYAYALYFYFDFSGYSDLSIGSARLLGIELPENFNNPFLKKNIRELWTNWHMSLTGWLVDYIYWPLVRKMRDSAYFRERPVLLSNVGMITTFVACGMWHGEAVNFLMWGAYHGLGITVLTIYQRQKRKTRNAHLQRYFGSKVSVIVGTFFTFNFFAVGLALFVLDIQSLKILLGRFL